MAEAEKRHHTFLHLPVTSPFGVHVLTQLTFVWVLDFFSKLRQQRLHIEFAAWLLGQESQMPRAGW